MFKDVLFRGAGINEEDVCTFGAPNTKTNNAMITTTRAKLKLAPEFYHVREELIKKISI